MRKPVALNVRLSRVKPRDVLELSDLCLKHNVLDLYLWLSIRYPEFFVERELCLEQKSFAIECIQESLESTHLQHRFSHSNEYKSMRIKFLTGRSQGLPSLSYGAVRASYENNIALINERDLYVFPTLIEEDGGPNPGHGSNRDKDENTRKPKTMASGKALPVGLLPVSNIRQPIMNKRESTPSSSFFGSDRTPVRSTDQEAGRTPIHHQYSTSKTNLVFNEITRQYEKPKDDVVKPAVVRAADVGVGVAAATGSRTTSDSNVDEKQVKQHSLYKTVGPRPLNSLTKLPLLSLNSWKIGSSNSNSNSNNNSNSSSSSSDRGKHPGTVPWVGTKAPTPGTPAARTGSILSKAMILNE